MIGGTELPDGSVGPAERREDTGWRRGESRSGNKAKKLPDPDAGALAKSMVEAAGIEPASESLLWRHLHAYPRCGGNPRPKALFPVRLRDASTRRIAPRKLSLSLTGGAGKPPAKPTLSSPFPARQAWSGRTWLKQPEPAQCWRVFLFHRLREVDPRHAVTTSCTFVEPSTPPPSCDPDGTRSGSEELPASAAETARTPCPQRLGF